MTDFRIDVIVDPARARSGSRKVGRELGRLEKKSSDLGRTLRRTFQAVGTAFAVAQLVRLGDQYQNLQNRLRVVTDGQDELERITNRLAEAAERSRGSFAATVELYSRVALSAQELGRSQEELLQFTESLNQAVALSGASAQEAQAGLIQLSQGLASGALRGDELRSVLEQLPIVADVIAKELGVTRGELRVLGAEGKISADIVLDAFKNARTELRDRFGKAVPTLGQGFVRLRDSLLLFVGDLDKAIGGAFKQGASALTEIADSLTFLRQSLDRFQGRVREAEEVNASFNAKEPSWRACPARGPG
jgi:tape measure domain-containing protein